MRVTIGVLGAGSLFGQGIIKALKHSSLAYRLVAMDAFPHAVGLYWGDAAYVLPDILAPRVTEEQYLGRVLEIITQEQLQLLLVATDFDVPRLATAREMIEAQSGCRVVVSAPDVVEIADDKWATYQFCRQHGLPCPPSLIDLGHLERFTATWGFPLIVKPRRGARSRGVSLVSDPSELAGALRAAGPDPIVQVAVGTPDREYTCGAVVFERTCFGVIVMRRDLRDGNTLRAFLRSDDEGLEALIERTALLLNPFGPVNIQLRVGDQGPAIFEINARFSGTTIIRTLAGFQEVEAVVRWVLFKERMPLTPQRSGVVLRYWEELFVPWESYERIGAQAAPR